MTYHPTPLETLFLWRLLANEGGEFLKDVKPDPKPVARRRLEQAGMIECTKRRASTSKGRGRPLTYISLTEAGWGWAAEHLDAEVTTRSPAAGSILHAILRKLKTHLANCPASLADFITGTAAVVPDSAPSEASPDTTEPDVDLVPTAPPRPEKTTDLAGMICAACGQIRRSNRNGSVRLTALRKRLPSVPAEHLNQTLLVLEKNEQIVLYPIDNPHELSADDANAALPNSAGFDRHLLYLMEN